ncbi:MAG: Crp/Fnr family transcriptional regulator [Rhodothalassiaceae bacterium]
MFDEKSFGDVPVISKLRDHYGSGIDKYIELRSVDPSRALATQGDGSHTFFLILRGWVRLVRLTGDGRAAGTDLLGPGALVGLEQAWRARPWPCEAVACGPVSVLAVSAAALRRAAHADAAVAEAVADHLADLNEFRVQQIEHLSLQSSSQRVACYILRQCEQDREERSVAPLPPSKALIAAELSIQPETFSRTLSQLGREAGVVVANHHVVVPSLKRLAAHCCQTCSIGFPCKRSQRNQKVPAEESA